MPCALEMLATVAPEWVQSHLGSAWYERYGQELGGWQWPDKEQEQETVAHLLDSDSFRLRETFYAMAQSPVSDQVSATSLLYRLEAVQVLSQVWLQQYYREGERVQ